MHDEPHDEPHDGARDDAQVQVDVFGEVVDPTGVRPGTVLMAQAPTGIPTVTSSDEPAALLAPALARLTWPDGTQGIMGGDIVVVAAKAVARAEKRFVAERPADGEPPADEQRSRLELPPGMALRRPLDADRSAHRLRVGLNSRLNVRPAVVVAGTVTVPGRAGVVDVALGAAGLRVLDDHRGRTDEFGRVATRTVVAAADHVAATAALLTGTLARTPVAVLRGLGHLTIPDDGPGVEGAPGAAGAPGAVEAAS